MPGSRTRNRATSGRGSGARTNPSGTAATLTRGGLATYRRPRGVCARPAADHLDACRGDRRQAGQRERELDLASGQLDRPCERARADVRERPELVVAEAPVGADDRAVGASRRERRPFAGRQQAGVPSLDRRHAPEHPAVTLVPADPGAEDVLPHEHPDAVQPGAPELVGVVPVPTACVMEHVPLLVPARTDHARHCAVGEPLRPREMMIADPRERHGRLALESDFAESGGQLRVRLLHRVEEDPVGAELAHDRCDRLAVGYPLAPRAGVPRVVVDEHAHAASLDDRRRARGCRERRGRSRTGFARRSRSPGRRARARARRSRRTRARPRRAAGPA